MGTRARMRAPWLFWLWALAAFMCGFNLMTTAEEIVDSTFESANTNTTENTDPMRSCSYADSKRRDSLLSAYKKCFTRCVGDDVEPSRVPLCDCRTCKEKFAKAHDAICACGQSEPFQSQLCSTYQGASKRCVKYCA